MDEAIRILQDLADRIRSETWVAAQTQQAVLMGIKMSIERLRNEAAKS